MPKIKVILKQLIVLPLIITIVFSLSACSGYRDLDKMLFVTSILVDYDDEKQTPVFYFEAFKPIRSSNIDANSEERIVFKIEAVTAVKAIQNLRGQTSSSVTFTHNKIILFSTKMAEMGFKDYFDLFDRGQEFIERTKLGIFDCDPEEYVKTSMPEEKMTGLYLYDMINNNQSMTPEGMQIDVKEFMNQRYIGDKVNTLPLITLTEDNEKQRFKTNGIAIIKDYTMLGKVNPFLTSYFNMMIKERIEDILLLGSPQEDGKICAVRILRSSLDTKLEYNGETLKVIKIINIKAILAEAQGSFDLTEINLTALEKGASEKVQFHCMELFNEYKDKGLDIFDIQEEFERKYPDAKNDNVITITELEIQTDVDIEGTTTSKSFS
jgi:Ger(x)C family germination protein